VSSAKMWTKCNTTPTTRTGLSSDSFISTRKALFGASIGPLLTLTTLGRFHPIKGLALFNKLLTTARSSDLLKRMRRMM